MLSGAPQLPTHRYRLGILPTPIHEWRLPGLPEGVRVLAKRDDLSGMQLSGNKVRDGCKDRKRQRSMTFVQVCTPHLKRHTVKHRLCVLNCTASTVCGLARGSGQRPHGDLLHC